MEGHKIDIDRGVTMRQIVKFDEKNTSKFMPDTKYGGMIVYMYKDNPGVFYDVHGNELAAGIAELAGFDVRKLAKLRAKREAMAAFEAKLQEQLQTEEGQDEQVLKEAGDWKVVALPMGRAKVVDKETGEMVSVIPMAKAEALTFLAMLTKTEANIRKESEVKE